jgi:hypothetical protein
MTKEEFTDLICFCILMENGRGIIDRAPSYVIEKYRNRNMGEWLLDDFNKLKLAQYLDLWGGAVETMPNGD